jgi:hypothetical protein
MNEEALLDSYKLFTSGGYKGSIDDYKKLMFDNSEALNDSYKIFSSRGYNGDLNAYKELIGVKKKRDTTALPSEVGSSVSSKSVDPEAIRFAKLAEQQAPVQDLFKRTGAPLPIQPIVGKRKDEEGYIDPRKKLGMYPTQEQVNRAMSQSLADTMVSEGMAPEIKEKDYFEGGFGAALRTFDTYSPIPLGEAIDDTARTLASGYAQGQLASAANDLILSGTIPKEEEIESLLKYSKVLQELGPSDAFINFQKKSEEVGGGLFGFFRGVTDNPTVLPELIVNSFTAMATNKEAVLAGAGAVLTNAMASAAVAGAPTAGVGAAPGFVAGATAALPVAMGLASGILTTGATFAELLQQELGTDEFGQPIQLTKENVKAILENPEKFNRIRNKSIIKGATVGAIDFVTGKAATAVGAKILGKSAATSATGEATRGAYTKSVAAGTGIESAGGGFGEFAGTAAAGEKQNLENVLFEMFTEAPMGGLTTVQARFAAPVYRVNNKKVTPEQVDEIIDTMEPADLAKANIKIENDYEGRNKRMQDKIVTGAIAEEVKAAQPDLNNTTVNAIVELQKQLNVLEGNKTQVAKDRAAQIRTEIKNLQDNPLPETPAQEIIQETKPTEQDAIQEQAAGEVPVQPTTTVGQEVEGGIPQAEPQVTAEEGQAQEEVVIPILNKDIEVKSSEGKKGLVPVSELEEFIGEDRLGEAQMPTSRATIDRLKEDISKNGFKEPIVLVYDRLSGDGEATIIEGNHRIIAAKELGLKEVPVTFEKGTIRTDESRVKNNMFPIKRKTIGIIDDTMGVIGSDLGLTVRQPTDADFVKETQEEGVSLKTPTEEVTAEEVVTAPKLVRDISVLITPATVRAASPLTKRIKTLSVKYDKLVKEFSKTKDKKTLDKIKEAEAQILNDAKQEIIDDVSKVKGVSVSFGSDKRGLWDGSFEPSLNMSLSISPQADTQAVSEMLFDFSEKYSQDAFILEADSNYERGVMEGRRGVPLTEFDENGLMHYPQIVYTFDAPITDEQVADLSVELQNNGIDAFSINNDEIKVSVIKFFSEAEDANLTNEQKNEDRKTDYKSKLESTGNAISNVFGSSRNGSLDIRVKKSSYQGAKNEGTADQSREYDRSDVLKPFQETVTDVELRSTELAKLRQKQIDLQSKRQQLSKEEQERFDELNRTVQPTVQKTFEVNKALYEDAKSEVEKIAEDATKTLNASLSPFPIKRPERASVKTIRWYNSFTEKLGDGARVNIVVENEADAKKVFDSIDKKYPVSKGDKDLRRVREVTELGYPKKLIEVRTSNGIIAEIQVITNEAYLAKDGLSGFTGDQKQKNSAKTKLDKIRKRLGWAIPDGLGHYFYEIQRDINVDDNLRDEATRLSNLYYDAFTNPKSTLNESFMDEVIAFKQKVDSADKSNWDKGNEGKTPQPLAEYISGVSSKTPKKPEPVAAEEAVTEFVPLSPADIKESLFNEENAVDFEVDFREDTRGRRFRFLSSITIQATDGQGNSVGTITKLSDGENKLSFTVEDANGRAVAKGKQFPTLRDAKVALAEAANKIRQKEFEKQQQAVVKEAETTKAKAEKAKARETARKKAAEPQVEEEVVEEVKGKLDELLELDPKQRGTGQKILDGIDGLIKDIETFEKNTLGVNIALPVMKTILQGIRALVQGGMILNDAIKQAAKDNNVTVRDVVNGINAVSQILPIQAEYDALMTKADALIKRQKSRGIEDKKIVSNLDTMIRNSDVYKNATDAQRKIMEREARTKMGVGPRKAASIGRVIGALKDITNVSRKEKLQIISRIRDLSRDVAKDLAQDIRDLAQGGKITAVQAANIISKFGKVNMLNEMSVSNFVDYMAKVFADADYDNKINIARGKISKARNNIATKIGIADGLMLPLQKLFAVNPTLIPDAYLERYLELLDMFSANKAVLTLEENSVVKNDTEAILRAIDEEQSKADELADVFGNSNNQVFEDGVLDYAASLKRMVKVGEITEEDAQLMRKYKQDIIPQVEPTPLTDEEIAEKKREYIAELKDVAINTSGLPSQLERNLAKKLSNLIGSTRVEDLMKLSITELKNLLKVADNINNNYLPHYAQLMVEKINAAKYGRILAAAIKKAKPLAFSTLYSRFKSAVIRSQKGGIAELVRRTPSFNIDQVFGDFKTKDIFNALFEQAAEAEASFKAELKKVQTILENAETKVAKSFKLNPDKTLMSKFKMMTYMIQLEYESNKGSEQVNPASDYLKETIKHIEEGKSRFKQRDADMLQEILDDYSTDKQIDIEKLYNSFNQAEKDAIADIRKLNESLKDKAQYTAAIIRGDAIDPLNNYVHLNVLHDTEPLDVSAATDFLNQANNTRRPSTRAKSLISRTPGAKPLNFDVFASAQRGAKFVILDYNLTEAIRTARRTINQTTADLEAEGKIPKMQRDVKNAIEGAFEESVSNLLTNSILQNSFADEVTDFISKQGYRAVLAGTGRFAAELTSNISFALLSDPKAFIAGTNYTGFIMSTDAPAVMENVNSKQTNRIFPTDTLSGRLVDTSILNQATGIQGRSSKNPVFNKMQQIYNLTAKKYKNVVELTADALISTPDKLVMRPLWFGSFANEFKKVSGREVDFAKIAANDQAYMDSNKDAIQQAKKIADERSVMTGATDNAFMGILKGTVKPNQNGWLKAFNRFNNYMTRFLIFEYVTARTAIYAMVGDGTLSKTQGAGMLAGVATRMTVYTLLSQMLANGIMGIFVDEEEEEDEKSLMQKIGQSLTSTFTSLLIGRDFGNATKLLINYGLEEFNERYLDFLREGEYDPYKDGIAYSLIPREDRPNDSLANLFMSMLGSLGPAYNTADLIYKNGRRIISGETTKKELDAIEREDRTVRERIPLEILGNLGYIPLYKDVRKIVNNSIYSSIKEAEKVAKRVKQREDDLLGGYDNKTDLKRYNPKLYEKNFGKGSEWYESTKEEREEKKRQQKEERAMKDRLYNYKPKKD